MAQTIVVLVVALIACLIWSVIPLQGRAAQWRWVGYAVIGVLVIVYLLSSVGLLPRSPAHAGLALAWLGGRRKTEKNRTAGAVVNIEAGRGR